MAYSESKIDPVKLGGLGAQLTNRIHATCKSKYRFICFLLYRLFSVYTGHAISKYFVFNCWFWCEKKIKPTRLLYVKSSNVNNLICEDLTFNLQQLVD